MLTEIANILQPALLYFKSFIESFSAMNQYVNAHFGLLAQLTLDLLILFVIFAIIYQIIKLLLRILIRIVVPAAILAGIVFLFTSYSFFNILPIFVCLLVAINLLRL